MVDLDRLRKQVQRGRTDKYAVKTYLTEAAHARLREAAAFAGVPQHTLLEHLINTCLPVVRTKGTPDV